MEQTNIKIKSLRENINRNIEVTDDLGQSIEDSSHSLSEKMRSLRTEISLSLKEQEHSSKSELLEMEERIASDTECKISNVGKSFIEMSLSPYAIFHIFLSSTLSLFLMEYL